MSLQERRAHIHELVDKSTSEYQLAMAEDALTMREPMTAPFTDEEERRMEEAREDYRNGRFVTLEEFSKDLKNWRQFQDDSR